MEKKLSMSSRVISPLLVEVLALDDMPLKHYIPTLYITNIYTFLQTSMINFT